MAQLLKTDGTIEEISPKNGTDFTIQELYSLIGCDTIEVIYLNNDGEDEDLIFIGDEEARLVDEPKLNVAATVMYRESWNVGYPYDIVGNIVVCKSKELK